MSIQNDQALIDKYKEIQDALSMTVKIQHEQVLEIVVADLMAKYKSCLSLNHECKEAFEKVLHYYMGDEDFKEMLELLNPCNKAKNC